MLKFNYRALVASCLFVATSTTALAATVTHTTDSVGWQAASATLSWSTVATSAINAVGAQANVIHPANLYGPISFRAKFYPMHSDMPLTSLTYDDANGQLLGAQLAGGIKYVTEDDGLTNTGGTLAISNLRIDLPSQTVFATLDGANGVGLIENMALWQFTGATGSFSAENGLRLTIPNLAFTQDGMNQLSQGLGLTPTGQSAWNAVTSFGAITAVPEASTYSMVLMGLMGLAAVARRKARH